MAPFITDFSAIAQLSTESELNDASSFDYVVIGGGTAGCVLAARLSEDSNVRVLLLESGGSGMPVAESRVPSAFTKLYRSKYAFQMYTEPQKETNNRKHFWPRGKLLGGCSSINAQMAQYGDPGDFDLWASIIGDESWSWKHFSKYFRKFEDCAVQEGSNDKLGLGSDGPVRIGYFTEWAHSSQQFVKACTEVGIPFSDNFNTDNGSLGVNRMTTYVDDNRQRVSSESAYLTAQVLARPNLKVAIHAHAKRLLFDTLNERPRVVGVEFSNGKDAPVYKVHVKREAILSAGAVHSPQLLLLSGVGPAEQLRKHRINVIHDLPGVGEHLIDHIVVGLYFKDKSETGPAHMATQTFWQKIQLVGSIAKYQLGGYLGSYGPLASNWGEAACFIRSDDVSIFSPGEYPRQPKDSKSSPNAPDLELFTTPMAYREHGLRPHGIHSYSIQVALVRPASVGNLRLKSDSVWDDPILDPKYLEDQADVDKLVKGVRLGLKLSRTEALASITDTEFEFDYAPLDHNLYKATDDELEDVVRDRTQTIYHPTSTCRMAPLAEGGVVDAQLKVYGIDGLRVCDASIFSSIPSGHTAGAAFAVGEKGADLVKASYTKN